MKLVNDEHNSPIRSQYPDVIKHDNLYETGLPFLSHTSLSSCTKSDHLARQRTGSETSASLWMAEVTLLLCLSHDLSLYILLYIACLVVDMLL